MVSVQKASEESSVPSSFIWKIYDTCISRARKRFNVPEIWTKEIHGILTTLGFVLGQSNINNFPYLCYIHGGQFVLAYVLCLVTIGIPVLLFERAISQFSSSGPFRSFDIMPAFRGVSITMFLTSIIDAFTYNIVLSWSLYYFGISFQEELPWATCGDWATPLCETNLKQIDNITCIEHPTLTLYPNGTCYNITNNTLYGISDRQLALRHNITPILPAKDFLYNKGFKTQNQRSLRLDLTMCLLGVCIIDYAALVVGLKRSVKLKYFAVGFPLCTLIVLFIFSIMQEGSDDGLSNFFRFDSSKFLRLAMWKDAITQLMYSLSLCLCGHMVISRKNNFHTSILKQVLIVSIVDALVSIYAAVTVFNFIGYFARDQGIAFDKVLKGRLELLYVIYPQACVTFRWSSIWSVMFFATTATLGFDSQIQRLNASIVAIVEMFPSIKTYELHVTTVLCLILFLIGLVLSINGYEYMAIISDIDYGWILSLIILSECCIISLYGPSRLINDITVMEVTNKRAFNYWRYLRWWFIICWCIVCPILTTKNIVSSFYHRLQKVEGKFGILSTILQIMIVIPIFAYLGYSFWNTKASIQNRLKSMKRSEVTWGPYQVKHRKLVTYVQDWVTNPRLLHN